jgi:hypothetical protein
MLTWKMCFMRCFKQSYLTYYQCAINCLYSKISVCSDFKASLQALSSYTITSSLVLQWLARSPESVTIQRSGTFLGAIGHFGCGLFCPWLLATEWPSQQDETAVGSNMWRLSFRRGNSGMHNRPNRGSRAGAYAPPTKINQRYKQCLKSVVILGFFRDAFNET